MSKRTEVFGEIASWEKNSKYKDLEAKKKKSVACSRTERRPLGRESDDQREIVEETRDVSRTRGGHRVRFEAGEKQDKAGRIDTCQGVWHRYTGCS